MESEKVIVIKKALECCTNPVYCEKECPYHIYERHLECINELAKDSLTLINELEEENERLLGVAKEKIYDIVEIKQLKDRINKLELENDDYKHRCEIIKGLIDSKRIVEFDVTAPVPPIHNIIY